MYSLERIAVCFWPLRFGFGGFGLRRAFVIQVIILVLLVGSMLGLIVPNVYSMLHPDEAEDSIPGFPTWFRYTRDSVVSW